MTLSETSAAFLRAKRRRLAESSYREYARVMEKMVTDLGEDLDISDLEPPKGTTIVEGFLDNRWADTPHAYNRNLSVVKGFTKYLLQREHLVHDPCAPLERAKPDKHARAPFSEEEVRAILGAASSVRDKIALRLLLIYGLRKGALTNLQLLCFDRERRVVSFKTKGRKYHVIPIASEEIWSGLEHIDGAVTDYLLHRRGQPSLPLSAHAVHSWWYKCLEAGGVVPPGTTSGRRLHYARHTSGQRILEKTGNLKAAQMLLGHASIQTTGDVYTGWDTEQLRDTMADLDVDDHDTILDLN